MVAYAMDNGCWGASVAPSPDYLQVVGSRWRQADSRRQVAQACIEWQAAHLAGCSPEVVAEYEEQYLLLIRQAKMLEVGR